MSNTHMLVGVLIAAGLALRVPSAFGPSKDESKRAPMDATTNDSPFAFHPIHMRRSSDAVVFDPTWTMDPSQAWDALAREAGNLRPPFSDDQFLPETFGTGINPLAELDEAFFVSERPGLDIAMDSLTDTAMIPAPSALPLLAAVGFLASKRRRRE